MWSAGSAPSRGGIEGKAGGRAGSAGTGRSVSYGYRTEPTWLEVNHSSIPIDALPDAFSGFRIVQLSDFHCSRQVTPSYLGEAVELARAQHADLVVLTGDFVHQGFKYIERVADTLGRLSAPRECSRYWATMISPFETPWASDVIATFTARWLGA